MSSAAAGCLFSKEGPLSVGRSVGWSVDFGSFMTRCVYHDACLSKYPFMMYGEDRDPTSKLRLLGIKD